MGVYFFIGLCVVAGVTVGFVDILKSIVKEMRENHKELTDKLCDIKVAVNENTILLCEVDEIEDIEE